MFHSYPSRNPRVNFERKLGIGHVRQRRFFEIHLPFPFKFTNSVRKWMMMMMCVCAIKNLLLLPLKCCDKLSWCVKFVKYSGTRERIKIDSLIEREEPFTDNPKHDWLSLQNESSRTHTRKQSEQLYYNASIGVLELFLSNSKKRRHFLLTQQRWHRRRKMTKKL